MVYKKYDVFKAEWEGQEPPLKPVNAYEITVDNSVWDAFSELPIARTNAINFLHDKTYLVDETGNVTGHVAYSPLQIENSMSAKNSAMSTSSLTDDCVATPVSDDDMTAHDYVNNSQNRRELFNKLKTNISTGDQLGYVALYAIKYSDFVRVLENSQDGFLSTVGSVLGYLNVNNFSLATVDGGRMNGYLDFDQQTFQITSAFDGDCNDIPLDTGGLSGEYNFSYRGGAERMGDLLDSYGSTNDYEWNPRCANYQTACTGTSGVSMVCHTICTQWE